MASGPYYQSVQPDQTTSDDLRLSSGLLGVDYGQLAPQASMYPDPGHQQINTEYHNQALVENEPEDHAQLQGLVEAATSAAAQEQIRQRAQQLPAFAPPHQDIHVDSTDHDLATLLRDNNSSASKRKRSLSQNSAGDPSAGAQTAASDRPKRQKRATLSTPGTEGQDGNQSMAQYNNSIESPHHLDARAAGVHSAAALFRPPSDSSKKYTRPPMSKLFSSLELSPENFLYLQAAAKQFMLDPDHPERQACVGNRGKGDSDMVKLKLHQCVHAFLENGGWGEKYFGENAPPPGELDSPMDGHQRKFIWPRDMDRIIALCTPLLRRMVTNERQRQYAVESRKGGAKPDKANGTHTDQDGASNTGNHSGESSLANHNNYDPRLPQGTAYQVYMLDRDSNRQIRDRIDYQPHEELHWDTLTGELQRCWYEVLHVESPPPEVAASAFFDTFNVKVLTSSGLTTVSNEGEWQIACQNVKQAVWLEGVVKVVVDCAV